MKTIARITLLTLLICSVAQAHPGHDGHELVWEYNGGHVHLDWMIYAASIGGAIGLLCRLAKKRN